MSLHAVWKEDFYDHTGIQCVLGDRDVLDPDGNSKAIFTICRIFRRFRLVGVFGDQNLTHSTLQATFFSILAMAFLSHILARIKKAPVTVFLIAGILPTVPGAGIYRTVYYLIQGDQALSTHYLISTLHTAGAIALAIFITDSVVNLVHLYHEGSHARRN